MEYSERFSKLSAQLEQLWSRSRSTGPSPLILNGNDTCETCSPWERKFGINDSFDETYEYALNVYSRIRAQYDEYQDWKAHKSEIHGPISFVENRLPEHYGQFVHPKPVMNRGMLTYYDPIETSGSSEPAVAFFLLNGHRLGRISAAQMVGDYTSRDSELNLIDDDSRRIALRGCNSGYWGHGPSHTLTVLRLAGFPEGSALGPDFQTTQLEDLVRTKPSFSIRKR